MATVAGTASAEIDVSEYQSTLGELAKAQRKNVHRIIASGADVCPRYVDSIELVHATQITTVIANASYHSGFMHFKQTGSGTAGHTVTLSIGSFDGTNNTATFNAAGETLLVWFDAWGNGKIVENIGSVGLSAV